MSQSRGADMSDNASIPFVLQNQIQTITDNQHIMISNNKDVDLLSDNSDTEQKQKKTSKTRYCKKQAMDNKRPSRPAFAQKMATHEEMLVVYYVTVLMMMCKFKDAERALNEYTQKDLSALSLANF